MADDEQDDTEFYPMTATEALRHQLRELMAAERLSQRIVANSVGLDHSALSRFLNGRAIHSETFDALHAWTHKRSTPRMG